MRYGICKLSVIPIRKEMSHESELVSELLFNDIYEIIEEKDEWIKIKIFYDSYEGWIRTLQHSELNENEFKEHVSKAIKNSRPSYHITFTDKTKVLDSYISLQVGYELVFVTLNKKGLSPGENATFTFTPAKQINSDGEYEVVEGTGDSKLFKGAQACEIVSLR